MPYSEKTLITNVTPYSYRGGLLKGKTTALVATSNHWEATQGVIKVSEDPAVPCAVWGAWDWSQVPDGGGTRDTKLIKKPVKNPLKKKAVKKVVIKGPVPKKPAKKGAVKKVAAKKAVAKKKSPAGRRKPK